MELRYKFRIYPTKEQAQFFTQEIGNQRFIWNYFLNQEQTRYSSDGKFNFYQSNSSSLTKLKKELEFLQIGDSTALQQTLRSLETAMKRCFKKIGGFPKFKKRKEFDGSYTICSSHSFPQSKSQIKLPKIGWIKWARHRDLPSDPKTATIIQDGNHWYISLVVRLQEESPTELENVIGIDINSKDFVTSDGEIITNPKYLERSRKILKRRHRQHSKSIKGSNRRKSKQLKLRNCYRKIRNQRKDFVHQVSSSIVKNYDLICLEDLNVKGMQRFNGSMIQDNFFAGLRSALQYKAVKLGKHFVVIDRFDPSSKACNCCGHIKKDLSLSDRTYSCSNCGYEEDRDLNAALNIKEWGLFKYLNSTAGTAETGLHNQTNGRGDTIIGVDSNESIRYVSLNRQKFLSRRQEALNASASR